MNPDQSDLPTLFRALRFAARAHVKHRRKGGDDIPYVNHPIDIATQLATIGGVTDIAVLAAALLHDTVEDTTTEPEDIERKFGANIATLVAEVTDDPALTSAEQKVAQEHEAAGKSSRAKLIRIADKTCNVCDITDAPPPHWSDGRRMEYFAWAERVVGGMRGTHAALESAFDAAVARGRRVV
ncbi:MAG: bifunctional (p)ppGpp synthetase/guanosine-3',5'-bis(diphosphate) 3'-pyrophosphohydrolase, partial [Gemmatimonadaceae bacterium]|nr:bifunctional (p)ppGpp synthetase/guanosine-3',5'-bis(diphosphate) 3'-pyrophosphohydrolase [Gemmatimonadaceae bacterium]